MMVETLGFFWHEIVRRILANHPTYVPVRMHSGSAAGSGTNPNKPAQNRIVWKPDLPSVIFYFDNRKLGANMRVPEKVSAMNFVYVEILLLVIWYAYAYLRVLPESYCGISGIFFSVFVGFEHT